MKSQAQLELRVQILRHLADHPDAALTDGEVEREDVYRTSSDHRPAMRWKVPMP